MRRFFPALLLITLFTNYAYTQDVNFSLHWKPNEVHKYYFFHNTYHPKDTTYTPDTDTTIAKFKVLAATKKGFEVELTYDFSKKNPPLYPPSGLKKIVSDAKKKPIVLQLDSSGKYEGVKNWQQLKTQCQALVEAEKKKAPDAEKGTWDYIGSKFATKEDIESLLVEDIEFFFMLYGSQLRNNRKMEYEDLLPNPYSDDPIPAITNLEVRNDLGVANHLEIKMVTIPDKAAAKNMLKMINELIMGGEPENTVIQGPIFDMEDVYVFLNNPFTGTHKTAVFARYLKSANNEKIESYKFILAD